MLLTIPVLIRGEEGEFNRRGMLFRSTFGDSFMLSLYSCIAFHEQEELMLKFDIPETDPAFILKGRVFSTGEKRINDNHLCSEIVLSNIKANDKIAAEFFKPGFIVDSNKSWEELKRH